MRLLTCLGGRDSRHYRPWDGGGSRHFVIFGGKLYQQFALCLPHQCVGDREQLVRATPKRLSPIELVFAHVEQSGLGSRLYFLRQVVPFDHWITRLSVDTIVPSMFQIGPADSMMRLVSLAFPTSPFSFLIERSAPVWVTVNVQPDQPHVVSSPSQL